MHPSIQDIRQFQFSNHDKDKYLVNIKYTSYLDLGNKINIYEIIKNSRKARSQDYNKAIKKFVFNQTNNIKLIDELHKKTLKDKIKKRTWWRFNV